MLDESQTEGADGEVDEEKQKALLVLDYLVERMSASTELKEAM